MANCYSHAFDAGGWLHIDIFRKNCIAPQKTKQTLVELRAPRRHTISISVVFAKAGFTKSWPCIPGPDHLKQLAAESTWLKEGKQLHKQTHKQGQLCVVKSIIQFDMMVSRNSMLNLSNIWSNFRNSPSRFQKIYQNQLLWDHITDCQVYLDFRGVCGPL